jgi:hypothetical protein
VVLISKGQKPCLREASQELVDNIYEDGIFKRSYRRNVGQSIETNQ